MIDVTPASPAAPKLPAAIALANDVKAAVKATDAPGADTNVRSIVIADLAGAEVRRRTGILTDSLVKRKALDDARKKIQPTIALGYDPETKKDQFAFDKQGHDALEKANQKLTKLDAALGKVIEEPSAESYNKLKEVSAKS
jgi:hypothetical protein